MQSDCAAADTEGDVAIMRSDEIVFEDVVFPKLNKVGWRVEGGSELKSLTFIMAV